MIDFFLAFLLSTLGLPLLDITSPSDMVSEAHQVVEFVMHFV